MFLFVESESTVSIRCISTPMSIHASIFSVMRLTKRLFWLFQLLCISHSFPWFTKYRYFPSSSCGKVSSPSPSSSSTKATIPTLWNATSRNYESIKMPSLFIVRIPLPPTTTSPRSISTRDNTPPHCNFTRRGWRSKNDLSARIVQIWLSLMTTSVWRIGRTATIRKPSSSILKRWQSTNDLLPNHRNLGMTYCGIGQAYKKLNNYPAALKNYEKAVEILNQSLAPNDPIWATIYNNLGALYLSEEHYPEALEYLHKTLQIEQEKLWWRTFLVVRSFWCNRRKKKS